jgi:threonine synthase
VTDQQILDAQAALARHDGLFVEPASAAPVAGLVDAAERGDLATGQTVVVTVTGHGLKDVETALQHHGQIDATVVPVDADVAARTLGLA